MIKKGFTLVELLAVIVILAIILAIAIPSIINIINNSKKEAFMSNSKLIYTALDYRKLENTSFDPAQINENNIKDKLGISDADYESVSVTNKDGGLYLIVKGKNKWDGLVAYGNRNNMTVIPSTDFEKQYPIITITGSDVLNVNLGETYTEQGAKASDSVDGNITYKIVVTGSVNTNVVGTYLIIYSVTNSLGNSITATRTVNVVEDIAPVITMLGTTPMTINIGSVYTDAGATAADNIDGDITSHIAVTSTVNTSLVGTYTVTYNVSDSSGNKAVPVIRTVNVIDNIIPVITMLGTTPMTINIGSVYNDAGATARDNVDGNITGLIVKTSTVDTAVVGTYTVTYNVSDSSGNNAVPVIRTVNVVDNIIPVITLLGTSPITVSIGSVYTDAGAAAVDNVDGNITSHIAITNTVNTALVGTYTVTYNVTDIAGNNAVPVIRTVNVIDNVPPVITILGTNPITLSIGSIYTDAGATAVDNVDGDISSHIAIVSTVNTALVGSYTVTYTVSDIAGNNAVPVIRTVNVVDNVPPVITMLGTSPITINMGTTYTDAGATAMDNVDGNITSSIVTTNTVNTSSAGTYTVTYNVKDAAGNNATPVVRTVNVNGENISGPDYIPAKGVNGPVLATGMVPIKWDGSAWVVTSVYDPNWYNYDTTNKQWANAKTADGSMWVWIPRYIYKITSGWHSNTTGAISIQFTQGTNDNWNSSVIGSINTDTTANASNNTWTNHPAFTFGGTELTGIWAAKFEAASVETQGSSYSGCNNNDNTASRTIKILPNSVAWSCITVGNAFLTSRGMETKSTYGWGTSGTDIDTHLMKNVEWGAIAYLSKSVYGKETTEVWINNSRAFTTGCAASTVSGSYNSACSYTYQTTNGVKASTTGTIYGVYDMSGGVDEQTAAYLNNGNAILTTYSSPILSANAKYKDVYTVGTTDDQTNNRIASIDHKGDALYETSSSSGAWFTDYSSTVYANYPSFYRGGNYNGTNTAGIFASKETNGSSGVGSNGFRPVLVIGAGL